MAMYIASYIITNMALNDLRIIICLRKSDFSVKRISVYVVENLMKHGKLMPDTL